MTEKQAAMTETKNADGSTTLSMKLSEMSLEQLAQVNQALGRQKDHIREQMLHIRALMDKKMAEQRNAAINEQIARLQAERDGTPLPEASVDGTAPGAVLEVSASKH